MSDRRVLIEPRRRDPVSPGAFRKGEKARRGWGPLRKALPVGLVGLVLVLGLENFTARTSAARQQTQTPAPAPSSSSGSSPDSSSPSPTATAQNPAPANPAEPGAPPGSGQISVRVQVVNVPVTVLDKRGIPVIDLTQKDFQVFEDGQRQTITYFLQGNRPPLRIGLVLDTSNTARRQIEFERDAGGEFVFKILTGRNSPNQIFLETFDAASSILQDFTNDPEILNEKISSIKAGGGKAVYDAIYYACRERMLKAGAPSDTRRVLVLVSDGVDVQSHHSLDEAISMAHLAETAIYPIANAAYGYTNDGDKILEELAADTGGRAFFPLRETPGGDLETGYLSHGNVGDTSQNKGLGAETGIYSAQRLMHLADSLDAIGNELNEQYSLGYTPTRAILDGTYRNIRVQVRRQNVSLRSKPGYFASPEILQPAEPPKASGQ
ncbi:MAG: VWA domain-containing protein [Terriglobia bacterium]